MPLIANLCVKSARISRSKSCSVHTRFCSSTMLHTSRSRTGAFPMVTALAMICSGVRSVRKLTSWPFHRGHNQGKCPRRLPQANPVLQAHRLRIGRSIHRLFPAIRPVLCFACTCHTLPYRKYVYLLALAARRDLEYPGHENHWRAARSERFAGLYNELSKNRVEVQAYIF